MERREGQREKQKQKERERGERERENEHEGTKGQETIIAWLGVVTSERHTQPCILRQPTC